MKRAAILIISAVTILSCFPSKNDSTAHKIFGEMEKKFGEEISLSIKDSKYITISILNSKKSNLRDEEKEKYANEIALYLYKNALANKGFSEITIKYKIQNSNFFVQSTSTIAQFDFNIISLENEIKTNN